METVEIRQCWAYNRKGQRCEHPAGHPGNHVITDEWTDDECASPAAVTVTTPVITTTASSGTVTVTNIDPEVSKCVGCNHAHKHGPCKCGCYEFIG